MKKNNKIVSMSLSAFIILFIIISITIVIITTVIPHFLGLINGGSDARVNSILSIIANISGGLIAGIVAYITAKYQVDKIEKQNKENDVNVSLAELKFIKQELAYNLHVFESLSTTDNKKEQIDFLSDQLITHTWNNTSITFVNFIDDNLLDEMFQYYSLINFIIKNKLADDFTNNITLNKELIEKIDIKITELNGYYT